MDFNSIRFVLFLLIVVSVSGRNWNIFTRNTIKSCQSSDDCRRGECCAIGFTRFSTPTCKPMGKIDDWCFPENEPENLTLFYPYGAESYSNIYRNFCPCKNPLNCERNVCKYQ